VQHRPAPVPRVHLEGEPDLPRGTGCRLGRGALRGETGDDIDKFSRCAWHPGPGGVPLLEDCPNRFVGAVRDRIDAGDHVGFLLEPTEAEHATEEGQFSFHRAKRIDPGHPA
jgi:flavin reductase (DIM6/NTAB) family NADH-FMN oxidoreductase RutF